MLCFDDTSVITRAGPHLAANEVMPGLTLGNFSAANLVGGLIFGSIGFVAFVYGKRMSAWKPMFLGLALMVFPYFVESALPLYVAGTLGTGLLYFARD
jgi:hypothetical protein